MLKHKINELMCQRMRQSDLRRLPGTCTEKVRVTVTDKWHCPSVYKHLTCLQLRGRTRGRHRTELRSRTSWVESQGKEISRQWSWGGGTRSKSRWKHTRESLTTCSLHKCGNVVVTEGRCGLNSYPELNNMSWNLVTTNAVTDPSLMSYVYVSCKISNDKEKSY